MCDRRLLGKSKDGRILRGIANTSRGLHPNNEQALHAVADRLDQHAAEIKRLQAKATDLETENKTLIVRVERLREAAEAEVSDA